MSKIALITGVTAGIGEACARLFAQQNYDLVLIARRAERLQSLAEKLTTEFGIRVKTLTIDVRKTYLNGNVYCATKYAVDSLNKAMRIDLLQYKIKVTGIHPGAVETEFSEVRFKGDQERAKKIYEGYEPLHAQDIAETIWFAVSRPPHVNINDLVVMPTAQANTSHIFREG